jgi:hypothetical protein
MMPNHPLQRTRRKRRAAERERWAYTLADRQQTPDFELAAFELASAADQLCAYDHGIERVTAYVNRRESQMILRLSRRLPGRPVQRSSSRRAGVPSSCRDLFNASGAD